MCGSADSLGCKSVDEYGAEAPPLTRPDLLFCPLCRRCVRGFRALFSSRNNSPQEPLLFTNTADKAHACCLGRFGPKTGRCGVSGVSPALLLVSLSTCRVCIARFLPPGLRQLTVPPRKPPVRPPWRLDAVALAVSRPCRSAGLWVLSLIVPLTHAVFEE